MASREGSARPRLPRGTTDEIGEDTISLRPCTANPTAVEDAATGDDLPLKRCPTKRKPAGSAYAAAADFPEDGKCEAFGVFLAQARACVIENTLQGANPLPKRAAAGGNGKLLEQRAAEPMAVDLFLEQEAELRNKAKAVLLRLPEAVALKPEELEAAVDRIIMQNKPDTASVAAPGMVRLPDDDIRHYFLLYKMPTVDDLLGVTAGGVFPPGWIETRRQQLDEQLQQPNKNIHDDFGLYLAKIRIDLVTKGYVELPKEYVQSSFDLSGEIEEWEGFKQKDHSDLEFAGSDDDEVVVMF